MTKTNAARILEQAGILHEIREYHIQGEHQSAEDVALALGISPEKLYKTLVLKGNHNNYLVAVIPANAHLSLKKLALVSGNKSCEMLPMKDLFSVTGYIRGGCSPIGMKKQFPTFIEEMALLENQIIISAGKKGFQLLLNPEDLIKVTSATATDLLEF